MENGKCDKMNFFKQYDIFESDHGPVNIDKLCNVLRISKDDTRRLFRLSRRARRYDQQIQSWNLILSMLSTHISIVEPDICSKLIRVKIVRWLKIPNSHFAQSTPISIMLNGGSKRVVNLLEQIL